MRKAELFCRLIFVQNSVNANIGLPYVMVPLFTAEELLFNRAEANAWLGNFSAARSEILPRLMYSRIPGEHPASIARAGLPDLHARSDSDMAGIERVALQLANALDEPAPRRSRGHDGA